jgi:hypothetical protein
MTGDDHATFVFVGNVSDLSMDCVVENPEIKAHLDAGAKEAGRDLTSPNGRVFLRSIWDLEGGESIRRYASFCLIPPDVPCPDFAIDALLRLAGASPINR